MEVVRELMKRPRSTETLAIVVFAIAVLYAVVAGTGHTALLGVGFILIVLGALPRQIALAFLVGASVILLVQTKEAAVEGFTAVLDVSGDKAKEKETEKAKDAILKGVDASETKEGFSKNADKPMLPDNADRKEPLVLGKPYKLPNEEDDKGFHLDSGTTFLNAYKALKPDQIAAMTKDTQELLSTQKALMGMLDSFGPLMKDMNKITGFFGPSGN
jgi:hypothetical protein